VGGIGCCVWLRVRLGRLKMQKYEQAAEVVKKKYPGRAATKAKEVVEEPAVIAKSRQVLSLLLGSVWLVSSKTHSTHFVPYTCRPRMTR
jgi:hypothetical protein